MSEPGAPAGGPSAAGEAGDRTDVAARVTELLETVLAYAVLDFSRTAAMGDGGDDLDGLAAGINMLGEELAAVHHELEQRTTGLMALTERLEDEVAERRRVEQRLARANTELSGTVERLNWFTDKFAQLTEMSNVLQVAGDREEAVALLGQFGGEVFTGTAGDVYIFAASRDVLEVIGGWGGGEHDIPATISRGGCWALRRGRLHRGRPQGGLRCAHMPRGVVGRTLCVPLTAQGEILGLLHLRWEVAPRPESDDQGRGDQEQSDSAYEQLAMAAGEQIALAVANLDLRATLRSQSIRDPLTGLYNRRFLDETLNRELQRAGRDDSPVSVLMLDIDHFKSFNDRYGHAAGDAALRDVVVRVLEGIRGEDVAVRYGGEELVVVMAGLGPADAASRAEHIRTRIAESPFAWHGRPLGKLTVSIGVAAYPGNAATADQLVHAADTALYEAKSNGRDRVALAT